MLFANCHNHSTFSDGVYTPEELVSLALQVGHRALILTDHDTVRGTYFLARAARKAGLLTLLGCEFGTVAPDGESVHLLGLDFNPDYPEMQKLLAYTSSRQTKRSHLMFEAGLARGTLRAGITWQDVLDDHPFHDYFCNNQVFESMVQRGIYKKEEYAAFYFDNFSTQKPEVKALVKENLHIPTPPMTEVIDIIRRAGGVPVVAHPHGFAAQAEKWVSLGVLGFETIHPGLDEADEKFFDAFCAARGLYRLGGTDHSSLLGGYADTMPDHDLPATSGYTTEAEFMKLWRRELG